MSLILWWAVYFLGSHRIICLIIGHNVGVTAEQTYQCMLQKKEKRSFHDKNSSKELCNRQWTSSEEKLSFFIHLCSCSCLDNFNPEGNSFCRTNKFALNWEPRKRCWVVIFWGFLLLLNIGENIWKMLRFQPRIWRTIFHKFHGSASTSFRVLSLFFFGVSQISILPMLKIRWALMDG